MKKLFLLGAMVCALAGLTASCTRIKNKVVGMVQNMEGGLHECNISSLYPALDDNECIGYMDEDFFYNYWFRYRATPADVEAALLANECPYMEIAPDTALVPCSREYILSEMKMPPKETCPELSEWCRTDSSDHLLYFRCTRTPLQHLLVFDTLAELVYHYVSEFRE